MGLLVYFVLNAVLVSWGGSTVTMGLEDLYRVVGFDG
jgi:hypothetical protein